jgi:hypothetical protein
MGLVLPVACLGSIERTDVPPGDDIKAPARTALHPNVPNPFNPLTTIRFDLARPGRVELRIYDVAGHVVRTLVDGELPAGRGHAAGWNGQDDAGRRVASGVYFYRLAAGDFTSTRRLVLLK